MGTSSRTFIAHDNIDEPLSDKPYLFNCSILIEDLPTPSMIATKIDYLQNLGPAGLQARILGETIYDYIRTSFVDLENQAVHLWAVPPTGTEHQISESYRDFQGRRIFDFSICRKNQTASEIWLAAYVGKYIVKRPPSPN